MRLSPAAALVLALCACGGSGTARPVTVRPPATPCERLADLEHVDREIAERVRASLGPSCEDDGAGAWALVLSELTEEPFVPEGVEVGEDEEQPTVIRGTWSLAYAPAEGPAVLGEAQPLEMISGVFYSATEVDVLARHDYDGDGHAELALWVGTRAHEEEPVGEVQVAAFRDGAVQAYPPAALPVPVDTVRDVDGDGRPDLVSRAPYFGTSPWSVARTPCGGPWHVFHALPDGTFSDQDAVAMEALREECPAAPSHLFPARADEAGYQEGLLAVSCARLHGLSPDQTVAALRSERGPCEDEGWSTCEMLAEELERHARELVPAHDLARR